MAFFDDSALRAEFFCAMDAGLVEFVSADRRLVCTTCESALAFLPGGNEYNIQSVRKRRFELYSKNKMFVTYVISSQKGDEMKQMQKFMSIPSSVPERWRRVE